MPGKEKSASNDGLMNPFNPFQPVKPINFVGRTDALKVFFKKVGEVQNNNVRIIFIRGERGIGKTSLAKYARVMAERQFGIIGFHLFLGGRTGPKTKTEFIYSVVEKMIQAKSAVASLMKRIREYFEKYIIEVDFGILNIKSKELSHSLPKNGSQFLKFIQKFTEALYKGEEEDKGIMLILDELDSVGLTPFFSDFIKEINDTSASEDGSNHRILLVLCGTDFVYNKIIKESHRMGNIMKVIDVNILEENEVKLFYKTTFNRLQIEILNDALDLFSDYVNGSPQLMQLVGNVTFDWLNPREPNRINYQIASEGVKLASEEWGKKFLNRNQYEFLNNDEYKYFSSVLYTMETEIDFSEEELFNKISPSLINKAKNYLEFLSDMGVIEPLREKGGWKFRDKLLSVYVQNIGFIFLKTK